jgi:hypothetical protein
MSNGGKNCTNCRFFKASETATGFPGECRRWPPVQHKEDNRYVFTLVDHSAWCGEYKQVTS